MGISAFGRLGLIDEASLLGPEDDMAYKVAPLEELRGLDIHQEDC